MADDFASAAARHWDNSAFLFENGRFQEAAYLAGYVAECSLKFCVEQAQLIPREMRHELPILSSDGLELAKLLNPLFNRYQISTLITALLDWSETHRYEKTGFLPDAQLQAIVEQAHQVAEQILIPMLLDGYLEEVPQ
jgi:hypothetical protein